MGYKGVVLLSAVLLASYISSFMEQESTKTLDSSDARDAYWFIKLWTLLRLSTK